MATLYLAYGSNLCKRSMRVRCPTARPAGALMLKDAKLVFRGVADVIYSPGSMTPVGLWRIQPDDERALDRYEGVGSGFYAKEYLDIGKGQRALIYLMNRDGIMRPSQFYADVLRRGYADFGLPEQYLDDAIAESYLNKEPTEHTISRRKRQKANGQAKLVEVPEELALRRLARLEEQAKAWDAEDEEGKFNWDDDDVIAVRT